MRLRRLLQLQLKAPVWAPLVRVPVRRRMLLLRVRDMLRMLRMPRMPRMLRMLHMLHMMHMMHMLHMVHMWHMMQQLQPAAASSPCRGQRRTTCPRQRARRTERLVRS